MGVSHAGRRSGGLPQQEEGAVGCAELRETDNSPQRGHESMCNAKHDIDLQTALKHQESPEKNTNKQRKRKGSWFTWFSKQLGQSAGSPGLWRRSRLQLLLLRAPGSRAPQVRPGTSLSPPPLSFCLTSLGCSSRRKVCISRG